jgi:outer membrane protein TolC
MKSSISYFILTLLLASVFQVSNVSSQTLSLDDCINTALKGNSGLIAYRNAYNASLGQVQTAWGGVLPTIDISVGARNNWPVRTQVDLFTGRIYSMENFYSGSLDIRATYPGLGLYTYSNIRKSRHGRQSSFYDYRNARALLVLLVKGYYYDLLRAKMLRDVAQDAVKRGEERLRVAQSRYELGSASMSDVLKAKVQYSTDQLDLVDATNTYQLAKGNLAFVMGVDVNRDYEVDEQMEERTFDIDFNSALGEALAQNPEYRKSNFDLLVARDNKTIAFSALLPSLSIGMAHNTSVSKMADLPDLEMANASRTVYASLGLNIFNGFRDYTDLRTARLSVESSRANYENTRNKVALELRQAFLDKERSRDALDLAKESVAAAQEDVNLAREKYNLGAATILEVLDAEVSLKQAQTNQVQALFDYNLAISRLEKAMGRE